MKTTKVLTTIKGFTPNVEFQGVKTVKVEYVSGTTVSSITGIVRDKVAFAYLDEGVKFWFKGLQDKQVELEIAQVKDVNVIIAIRIPTQDASAVDLF